MKAVSIIIPAKNEEQYLPLCLESIKQLEYSQDSVEVIVVDNGSTDRTREIAQSFGVKILQDNTKNVAGLRNIGAIAARGEILAFLDADCMVAPDWLLKASRYFDDQEVVAWGGPPVPPDDASWVQKTWFIMIKNDTSVKVVEWLGTADLFVRAVQFREVGGFKEDLISCEDVDLCYRLGIKSKIVSDDSIKIIHLREANTLGEFFAKELWRGKSSFSGIRHHGLKWKELPSLMIPIYFSVALPLAMWWMAAFFSMQRLMTLAIVALFPSCMAFFRLRRQKLAIVPALRLLVLLQVYFAARTSAFIRQIFSCKNFAAEQA